MAGIVRRLRGRRLADAGGADTATVPEQESAAKMFAAKSADLESVYVSVVDAATVGTGLWLSYLFVLLYLAIATGSVTHRDLFFENPVRLPFLGVDLPLVAFFELGPLLFLIVHSYVLLHLVLLARNVKSFHCALEKAVVAGAPRAAVRRRLPSNVFIQYLAGPDETRRGLVGAMLRLIAYTTMVFGPLALLFLFELQFLPFHDAGVTWWHRCALIADLVQLWLLWPKISSASASIGELPRARRLSAALVSALTLWLAVCVFTYPGEWLDGHLRPIAFVPRSWVVAGYACPTTESGRRTDALWGLSCRMSLHEILVAGAPNELSRKAGSVWSNYLVLPNLVIRAANVPRSQPNEGPSLISLRGRDLSYAVLSGAVLSGADLTGANLDHAKLIQSDLRDVRFGCAQPVSPFIPTGCTSFAGSDLRSARLDGAQLGAQVFSDTNLEDATFRGADLGFAQFLRTNMPDAKLTGANLDGARFVNAKLSDVDFGGASMSGVTIEGPLPDTAKLHAAFVSPYDAPMLKHMSDGQRFGIILMSGPGQAPTIDIPVGWQYAVETLRDIGCEPLGAPYVQQNLIDDLDDVAARFQSAPASADVTRALVSLASEFQDVGKCPGGKGLDDEHAESLRRWASSAPAPP